jgi:hypothetical protein
MQLFLQIKKIRKAIGEGQQQGTLTRYLTAKSTNIMQCRGKFMRNGNYKFRRGVGLIGLVMQLIGCSIIHAIGQTGNSTTKTRMSATDYKPLSAWAAHPQKWDFSDSLPRPYRPLQTDTSVDVFFIHPTSFMDKKAVDETRLYDPEERSRWNANLDDETVNKITDKGAILNQASVFNQYRVFAPRYRQAHIRSFYIPDSISHTFFEIAYADVKAAFVHYLQYENNGRPFVLASHSQGTLHAGRLIKEMIEGQPLQEKLIAAYLIGLPVPENFFSSMQACTSPGQTGCVVSWRTFKKGYMPERIAQEPFKAIVVNPLSWTMETDRVPRSESKGAVLYKFDKPKRANVSTVIHGNILWSTKPRFFGNVFFTRKNYHIGDINLFWKDIRDNVGERVNHYKGG